MRLVVFYSLWVLFFVKSFASEVSGELEDRVQNTIKGDATIYGAYQHNTIRKLDKTRSNEPPNIGLVSSLEFKSLKSFGDDKTNNFGLVMGVKLDTAEKVYPLQVKEANIVITSVNSGTRLFGLQNPVSSKLKVNSTTFSGVSEGIAGRWQQSIRYPLPSGTGGDINTTFLTNPYLPLGSGFSSNFAMESADKKIFLQPNSGLGENNLGLSYISGRISGFRVGISYFPSNIGVFGREAVDLRGINTQDSNNPTLKNIFALGTNFYDEFNGVEVSFSANLEYGTAISKKYNKRNLNAIALGFNLSYLGFMLGGSFINYGKSLQIVNSLDGSSDLVIGNNAYYDKYGNILRGNAQVFDVGIGYAIEKYNINLSYLQSKNIGSKFQSFVFSFETKINKNLINYLQIARYRFFQSNVESKPANAIKSSGMVFLIGMQYKMM